MKAIDTNKICIFKRVLTWKIHTIRYVTNDIKTRFITEGSNFSKKFVFLFITYYIREFVMVDDTGFEPVTLSV